MLEVLLECLQEEFLVFGVRVARVINVVVRGVDSGRGELHPILKREPLSDGVGRIVIQIRAPRQTWQYCILETDASVQVLAGLDSGGRVNNGRAILFQAQSQI